MRDLEIRAALGSTFPADPNTLIAGVRRDDLSTSEWIAECIGLEV